MPDAREPEMKFFPNPELVSELEKRADSVEHKAFTDTYYDTANYELTTKDWWLRRRGDDYQLKTPPPDKEDIAGLQDYNEAETQSAVENKLDIGLITEQTLAQHGYKPFISIQNERLKLRFGKIVVCVDKVYNENDLFEIAEAERLITDKSPVRKAYQELIAFGKKHNLPYLDDPPKKISAFLKYRNPEHFNALIEAGVFNREAYDNVELKKI